MRALRCEKLSACVFGGVIHWCAYQVVIYMVGRTSMAFRANLQRYRWQRYTRRVSMRMQVATTDCVSTHTTDQPIRTVPHSMRTADHQMRTANHSMRSCSLPVCRAACVLAKLARCSMRFEEMKPEAERRDNKRCRCAAADTAAASAAW